MKYQSGNGFRSIRERREKNLCPIVLFNKSCRWSLFYRNYGGYLEPVPRGGSSGWLERGGCRCTLRCAVSITHPSAVSTSPNRRFCRRAAHFSYSNLFRPLSTPLRIRSSPYSYVYAAQQIFLRFLDHCFPYAPLFSHPLLITLFFRSRGCQRLRPTICLKLSLPSSSQPRMESLIAFISIGPAIFNIIFSSPLYSINFDQTVDKFFPQPP